MASEAFCRRVTIPGCRLHLWSNNAMSPGGEAKLSHGQALYITLEPPLLRIHSFPVSPHRVLNTVSQVYLDAKDYIYYTGDRAFGTL